MVPWYRGTVVLAVREEQWCQGSKCCCFVGFCKHLFVYKPANRQNNNASEMMYGINLEKFVIILALTMRTDPVILPRGIALLFSS
jgi:hypothetical protein